MFKNITLTLIAALALSFTAKGQSTKITGVVFGEGEETIAGATVMLINAQDSILSSYSITNKDGEFNLASIKQGAYIIKASFFGFLPFDKEITIESTASPYDMGEIRLEPKILDVVEIEGEYIPINIKGDTIEYDARAFETKEHDVVEDLLEQLPGVEVEEDGTIKVQGEEVTKILVDGEEFFGDDPKIATQNLPAKAVEKVQVFDKASDMAEFTGIDDGSESPTINLVLKESHKKGSFGNLEAAGGLDNLTPDNLFYQTKGTIHHFNNKFQISLIGMSNNVNETGFSFSDYANFMGGAQNISRRGGNGFQSSGLPTSSGGSDDGFLNTHSAGINFNYKPTKQTTVSASVFLNSFDKTYDRSLERLTYYSDSTLATDELAFQNSTTFNNRGELKLEQKFDSTHFLNVDLSGSWNKASYLNLNTIENYNSSGDIASSFNTNLYQNDFQYDLDGQLEYRKKFKKAGRYTGGGLYASQSNSDITTNLAYYSSLLSAGVISDYYTDQDQFQTSTTRNLSGNWMWSEPLSDNQLMQFKYTYNHDLEARNKEVFDVVELENNYNEFLSADGDYFQNSHEFNVKHKFLSTNFNTTIGASYQHLNLSGADIFTEAKNFQYVLPSARIDWDPNKKGNLRLTYNTSVTSPSLNQLQPLPDNTSPSEITLGNTELIPEYNHTVQLRFRNFNQFNFTFFMASLTGKIVDNNVVYSQNINEYLVKEIIPENLGTEKSLSGFFAFGTSLYALRTKFNVSGNASVSNGLVNLNGLGDEYTSYLFSPKITFENIGKKKFNIRTGVGYNYSVNQYRNNATFNNAFNNWNYYGDFSYSLKDRWVFSAKASHYFYPDFETNNQLLLMNASVAVNLLKSRKLQVYVAGNDLLNQNTGINQYYLQNIYEQEVTQTLARYFMVGVKYSFQKLGAK